MEEKIIEAKLLHIIYQNPTNNYYVCKFVTYDAQEDVFIATGYFNELEIEQIYQLRGKYIDHIRYGIQFQVEGYQRVLPKDESSLIRFFSSNIFKGIGKATAKNIVETLGNDAIEKIQEDHDVLLQVKGLNEKKRKSIVQGILVYASQDESTFFFTRFGVSVKNILKFEAKYGNDAVSLIKENPYRLIEEVEGIGFRIADKLAMELGFESEHPYRIRAYIVSCVLDACMSSGDTYILENDLKKLVYKQFSNIDFDNYISSLIQDYLLFKEDDRIYHYTQYESENGIASYLYPYVEQSQDQIDIERLHHDIEDIQNTLHITYETMQKKAFEAFFTHNFSILTGGPGTGKSTIVKGILLLYKKYFPNDRISICAPTGRAAKRIAQLCDCSATTIHSLLKWDLTSNTFMVNDKEPLAFDLLIIDEFSMVDQWLFYNLMKASCFVKKILIIGDEDQLPSVGCGCVLKDLIECGKFTTTKLVKIFRQSDGSDVITLAHQIKEEKVDIIDHGKDIAFFECSAYDVKKHVLQVVSNALKKGYDARQIQVLSPMYGGIAGIDGLNHALQNMINPPSKQKNELQMGYRIFREGDKVLQLKNQPEDDVYNGDIGEIVEIEKYDGGEIRQQITVDFEGILVTYSNEQLYNLTHAYCISIHKSQGSEYPIVVIPVVREHIYMLSKRLLYTAITRAKRSLVLLGSKEVFNHSIKREERHIRKSTLQQRILRKFE